jgi:uncharacterized membrane protein
MAALQGDPEMGGHNKGWSDEKVEQIVGNILRFGVAAAALVAMAGGVLYLIRFGNTMPNYAVFRGEPADLRSVPGIFRDVLSFHTRGLIQLGLLLLIATPVGRVVFSVVAFALQRDRTYIVVTLIVLGILLYSLAGGGL